MQTHPNAGETPQQVPTTTPPSNDLAATTPSLQTPISPSPTPPTGRFPAAPVPPPPASSPQRLDAGATPTGISPTAASHFQSNLTSPPPTATAVAVGTTTPAPQPAVPASNTQWPRGQQLVVLILALLAAALEMYTLGYQWGYYLPIGRAHLNHIQNEGAGASPSLLLSSFLFSHLPLIIIGIAQTVRRTAPTAFVAASITALASLVRNFFLASSGFNDELDTPLVAATYAILLVITGFTLWGRLPHRTHTPRSAIAASALGIASLWTATKLFTWTLRYFRNIGLILDFSLFSRLMLAAATLLLVCSTALLVLMALRKNVTMMRLLAIVAGVELIVLNYMTRDSVFRGGYTDHFEAHFISASVATLALAIPVFFPSFKQWCDGTWTARTSPQSVTAGRPTILARTYQTIGADGTPLDDASVAALLPSVRPTFWISFFFGLFGLIPMITANSTARGLGVVTHAYNHAMIKGLLLGIVTWFGLVFTLYAVVLFSALSSHY